MDEIDILLELHTLEEVFEVLDITPYDVVSILVKQGYVELPEYVRYTNEEQETSEAQSLKD
jgi:hypothetical protein